MSTRSFPWYSVKDTRTVSFLFFGNSVVTTGAAGRDSTELNGTISCRKTSADSIGTEARFRSERCCRLRINCERKKAQSWTWTLVSKLVS